MLRCACLLLAAFLLAACGPSAGDTAKGGDSMHDFPLTSTAFAANQPIPIKYTGDGADLSPPLAWSGTPAGAKCFALIVDDPDAPTDEPWVHWVLFNIPAEARALPEALDKSPGLANLPGAAQGQNSFAKTGWNGPSPPKGHGTHHYHFKLYALDAPLAIPASATKAQLLAAMQGHILAQSELIGTYERK